MNKVVGFIVVFVLLLSGCSWRDSTPNTPTVCGEDCEIADMSEYTTMEGIKDVRFKEISYKKFLELYEDESFKGMVYFGFPTCPWCIEVVPLLNEVAIETDISIFYVNKRSEENKKDEASLNNIIEIFDASFGLEKNEEGTPTLYVPEVIAVKDKKIVSHHMGTVKGHDARETLMNKDQSELLKSVYMKMAKKVE